VGPALSVISKEMHLAAVLEAPLASTVLVPTVMLSGALFVTVAATVAMKPFWGRSALLPKHPHQAPVSMSIGPAVLAALGFVFGLAPSLLACPLATPAVGAIAGTLKPVKLTL
jgi:multicomponent Na+:H+ antiporter subunit A